MKWFRYTLLILCLATAVYLSCETDDTEESDTGGEPPEEPDVVGVEPQRIDFGKVGTGESRLEIITLYPHWNSLELGISMSFDIELTSDNTAFSLLDNGQPSNSSRFAMDWDHTEPCTLMFTPTDMVTYEATVEVIPDLDGWTRGTSKQTVTVEGEGVSGQCEWSSTEVDFGKVVFNTYATEIFTIQNITDPGEDISVHLETGECSSALSFLDNGEADILNFTLQAGESRICSLQFHPWLPEHRILDCTINAELSSNAPCGSIDVTGLGTDPCAFSRNTIEFVDVPVGTTREDTFVVRNVSTMPGGVNAHVALNIGSCRDIKFVEQDVEVDYIYIELAPEEETEVTLRFTPLEPGPRQCALGTDCFDFCGTLTIYANAYEGSDWYECDSGTDEDLYAIYGNGIGEIYAGGDAGTVLEHGPACTWTDILQGYDDFDVKGIHVAQNVTNATLWIAGGNCDMNGGDAKVLSKTGPNPDQWYEYDTGAYLDCFYCMWNIYGMNLYCGGGGVSTDFPNGVMYNFTDWTTFTIHMGWTLITGICGYTDSDVWAVTTELSRPLWHYDGSAWTDMTEAWMNGNALWDVWVDPGGEAFAVGQAGRIYHYTGSVWEDQSIAEMIGTFYGVWGSSPTDVYAVGEGGAIYHYNGSEWLHEPAPAGVTGILHDVWGTSPTEKFIVGENGVILYDGS